MSLSSLAAKTTFGVMIINDRTFIDDWWEKANNTFIEHLLMIDGKNSSKNDEINN